MQLAMELVRPEELKVNDIITCTQTYQVHSVDLAKNVATIRTTTETPSFSDVSTFILSREFSPLKPLAGLATGELKTRTELQKLVTQVGSQVFRVQFRKVPNRGKAVDAVMAAVQTQGASWQACLSGASSALSKRAIKISVGKLLDEHVTSGELRTMVGTSQGLTDNGFMMVQEMVLSDEGKFMRLQTGGRLVNLRTLVSLEFGGHRYVCKSSVEGKNLAKMAGKGRKRARKS